MPCKKLSSCLQFSLSFCLSPCVFLCTSMSLFQSPDASVYLSHPLALCQFVNMSFLSLVLLGECSAFDVSLFRASHSSHACKYNIRECTWISPEAITLSFFTQLPSYIYKKTPHRFTFFLFFPVALSSVFMHLHQPHTPCLCS